MAPRAEEEPLPYEPYDSAAEPLPYDEGGYDLVEPYEEDQGWEEEGAPEGDPAEEYGGRGQRRYGDAAPLKRAAGRLQEAASRILPGASTPALKVGGLEVRAPQGRRGLVLQLDEGVFLMGDFDAKLVDSQGKDAVASAMIEAAKRKLTAGAAYGMGGAVAVPLVLALLKARREAEAEAQAQATVSPSLGCNGRACACGR